MSTTKAVLGALGGAALLGGITAGAGAVTGAIGADVLGSDYSGYDVTEAAQMGAIGSAIVCGGIGAIAGGIAGAVDETKALLAVTPGVALATSEVAMQVLLGLVGYAVLNAGDSDTKMGIGRTAASFGVGGGILLIPLLVVFGSCAACAASASKKDVFEQAEEGNKTDFSIEESPVAAI